MGWTFQSGFTTGSFISGSTTPFLIAGATDRRGLTMFNNTSANLFVAPGSSASLNSGRFQFKLSPGSFYEMPSPIYTGPVFGMYDVPSSGSINVYEFTS